MWGWPPQGQSHQTRNAARKSRHKDRRHSCRRPHPLPKQPFPQKAAKATDRKEEQAPRAIRDRRVRASFRPTPLKPHERPRSARESAGPPAFAQSALECADLSALWEGGSLLPRAGSRRAGRARVPAPQPSPRGRVRSHHKARTSPRSPKRCARNGEAAGGFSQTSQPTALVHELFRHSRRTDGWLLAARGGAGVACAA